MRRLLLYLITILCSTQLYAVPNLSQTDYRWRNDDGDEATATWAAAANTPTTITANGVIRLRLELANSGLTAATISQTLEYSSNGGASWGIMNNNAATDTFLYLTSTFVTDGTPTTNQSTSSTAGTFAAGKVITTPGATAQQSLATGAKTEYEWVIGPNPSLSPLVTTTYIFRASGLNVQPTVYPALTYLYGPTGCFGSGNLSATNITTTSVDLGWTEYGPATQWEIEYGLGTNYAQGSGTRIVTSTNPHTLILPSSSTGAQYSYFVRSICGANDTSAWSLRSNFTLIPSCPIPTTLTSTNITTNSVNLGWTENGTATTWEVEYGLGTNYAQGSGTRIVTSNNPYTLALPSSSTGAQYSYFVRSICGANDSSAWSSRSNFTLLPSCPIPTTLTVANITTNSADLGWTENGTATTWEVEYALGTSFTPGVGSGTVFYTNTKPHSLGSLIAGSQYSFFIRSVCGPGDTSARSLRRSFTILCNPITTLPWTENFDALATTGTTSYPPCWFMENGGWSTSPATVYNTSFSGPNHLRDAWFATNEFMWTPGFDLVANTSYDFSFYAAGDGWTSWVLDVFQNTTQSSVGASQIGGSYTPAGNNVTAIQPYVKRTYTFVPSTSGTYYFALRVNDPTSSPWYFAFDDFMLEVSPSCPAPQSPTTANVTTASADLQWTEMGTATLWQIEYAQGSNFAQGTGTLSFVSSNPYTLGSLTQGGAGGQYSYFVRSVCSPGDTSAWSQRTVFNLVASCDTPSAPTSSNVTAASADLGWTENGSATQWQIEYGTGTGFAIGTGTRTNVSSNPFALSTLNQGTQYSYFVRAVCGPNDTSAWSPRANFTTLVVCPAPTAISFSNITATSVDVAWTATTGTELLEYGPTGYVPGTGATAGVGGTLISPATSPVTINGLTAASGYDVFIRQDCSVASNGFSTSLSSNVATVGAPANDTLCGAYNVVLNSTTPVWVNTNNATTSASDPTGIGGCTTPNNNVWYTFTTTTAGVYNITGYSSSINTNTLSGNMAAWAWLYTAAGTCPSLTLTQIADLTLCTATLSLPETYAANGVAPNLVRTIQTPSLAAATTYYMILDGNSGSSGNIGITVQSPLNIKLDKLTATNLGDANRVDWNTVGEERSDRFELERSVDGKNFTKIYEKRANGEPGSYSYMDNNPFKGYNYYRLRMIEINGNAAYSETVTAFVKSNGFEVEVFPNPVSHNLTVRAYGVQGSDAHIQIMDVTGKVVKTIKMTGNTESVDMKGLASGMYLVKYADTNHTQTIRVNKN